PRSSYRQSPGLNPAHRTGLLEGPKRTVREPLLRVAGSREDGSACCEGRCARYSLIATGGTAPMMSRIFLALVIAFFTLCGPWGLRAQDYPNRPVTLVVPWPAGGTSD